MLRQSIGLAWFGMLLIFPTMGNAGDFLDRVKKGAAAVKESTSEAAEKVGDKVEETVTSTKESLGDEATPAATRAKLDEMAGDTLARLFAEQPSAEDLYGESYGYAVFDTRQLTIKVSAGYGRGVAVEKETDARTYMKMATGGVGLSFGLGGFASQLIVLFEQPADFRDFIEKGYEAEAEASALQGEERKELAARFTDGTAIFVLTEKGWKVTATVTGTKYWPDEELK
jgi:hypothetical protein